MLAVAHLTVLVAVKGTLDEALAARASRALRLLTDIIGLPRSHFRLFCQIFGGTERLGDGVM